MNPINASVVIPTHRSDVSTMRRLILTIDLFLNQGFEVVVSDNSGNQAKHEKLVAEFGNSIVYADTVVDCKAMDNFLAGFSAVSRDYLLFASDDDTFLLTGIDVLRHTITNTTGFIGFCASTVRYANDGITVAALPDLSSDSPIERMLEWLACDIAVSFYGCYHIKVWRRYFNFIRHHPLKFAHHDQLLRFIVADSGSIMGLNSAWFAYDYSNWANSHVAQSSLIHYYTKAGFDERMIYLHYVVQGLEGALMQIKLDEVAGREWQYTVIDVWWNTWRTQFSEPAKYYQETMPPELWQLIEPLVIYLSDTEQANVYQILQLLTDYMRGVYGTDGGLQQFWLYQAAESLRVS